MSKRNIIDAAELKRQMDYARTLPDEKIDTSDPDARVLSDEQWAKARPFHEMFRPVKKLVSIRLDADVLAYYQRSGAGGYQTRLNAALRAQMENEQRQAGGR